jgi:hypothetical protein
VRKIATDRGVTTLSTAKKNDKIAPEDIQVVIQGLIAQGK